jgi:Protein of unknown function (DUF1549)/Protein of unknown function (DUF1553)
MGLRVRWRADLLALLFACGTVAGSVPAKGFAADDARALAAKIDQHIAKRWASAGSQPAPLADDAEFLRRVYLDLAGRIPSASEARTFLTDRHPDRRARLVDQLLASSRYVAHFTNIWRALLLPEAGNNFQVRLQQGTFETWLKKQVARNTGYNQMVRDLLTTNIGGGSGPLALVGLTQTSPLTFYLAKEFRPENLAASTARVFLGVSVECAQCHNHPFADWKREQFWGFAAFYSGIKSQRQMDFLLPSGEDRDKHELTIPGTKTVVQAKFLDGTEPKWNKDTGARETLAEWVTSPNNPYFAKAAVNRLWAYFLGTGLVEPVDEMVGVSTTSTHPELLNLLAKEFAGHQFDLKFLIRAITASRAYQLTSAGTHQSQGDLTLFARMPLRGLTPEQLFDSVAMATGYRDSGGGDDLISGLLGGNRSARSEFLTRFAQAERPRDTQVSILQALTLMNGKVTAAATLPDKSETLAAVAEAPFLTTAERVETLYLATLSRKPEKREQDRAVQFVEAAVKAAKGKKDTGPEARFRNALADVFWALLNSPEFVLNH